MGKTKKLTTHATHPLDGYPGLTTKIRIVVTLKKSVLDPQGQTVQQALESLGFKGIAGVRMGKYIEIAFNGKKKELKTEVKKMCEKLLANPVIEEYEIL